MLLAAGLQVMAKKLTKQKSLHVVGWEEDSRSGMN
jgi:hypothetical protein